MVQLVQIETAVANRTALGSLLAGLPNEDRGEGWGILSRSR